MFKTIPIIVMATLCLCFANLIGASAQATKPLKVGDQVPEEFWALPLEIISLKEGKQLKKLSEYTEDAIILDFGNTRCASCIASLMKLDTLKNHFSGQLKILGVTPEKSDYLLAFLKRRQAEFSYIADNTILKDKIFPHITFPHLVWLSRGKVVAITDRNKVSLENLKLFINNKLKLPAKVDLHGIDEQMPLMMSGFPAINKNLIYQSTVAGFIPGVKAKYTVEQVRDEFDRKLMQFQITNHTFFKLLEIAVSPQYFNYEIVYPNRVIWEIPDSVKYLVTQPRDLRGETQHLWYEQNAYSYNLVTPQTINRINMYQLMEKELNQFSELTLGVCSKVEKRKVKVLALVRTTTIDLIKSVSPKSKEPITLEKNTFLQYINRDFTSLVYSLQKFYQHLPMPIIDETKYSGNIDLSLQLDMNFEKVRIALQKYGLDLVEKDTTLNMLIISKKSNN